MALINISHLICPFIYHAMTRSKSKFYQHLIHQILADNYRRMEYLISTLPPDGVNIDVDSKDTRTIKAVMAMEEEWIVDPKVREQLSLIDLKTLPPDDERLAK